MIDKEITKMVSEHVDNQIYFVEVGKKVNYTELFDKALLDATTPLEHRYVFERALAYLIAFEEVDLRIVGVNDAGQTLYRRMD
jgi:hypothetical protein